MAQPDYEDGYKVAEPAGSSEPWLRLTPGCSEAAGASTQGPATAGEYPDEGSSQDAHQTDRVTGRRRWGWEPARIPFWNTAVVTLVLVIVLPVGLVLLWKLPFGRTTDTHDRQTVVETIRDLSRFVAAEGTYADYVERTDGHRILPKWLVGDHYLLLYTGAVEAYVDFKNLDEKTIKVFPDRRTVEITLPEPQLGTPKLNHKDCRVFDLGRGIATRLSNALTDDPAKIDDLYDEAESRVAAKAHNGELVERAKGNTSKTLESMLRLLGYSTVKITFKAA